MTDVAIPPAWPHVADWRARAARAARYHPEWEAAAVAAIAWALMVAHGALPDHQGSAATHLTEGASALPAWTLMTAAMMIPATLPAVRHVALNSLRRRWRRAVGLFLTSYLVVWVTFGAVLLPALALLRTRHDLREGAGDPVLVAILAVAAAWQLSPRKRRLLRACQRTVPLPPRGWRADAADLRFGLRHGVACLGTCGALMAVMAAAGHHSLVWMAAMAVLVAGERLTRAGRRLIRPAGACLAVAAVGVALLP